jgi:hypothetical protein
MPDRRKIRSEKHPMNSFKNALLGGVLALMLAVPAAAQDAAQLGRELTPFGAIRAGNADGTIPAWTGGITQPPAGYRPGMHHPDPFADDAVKTTITAQTVDRYADKLSPGQIALLKQYPTFKMNVYPTRRSFSAPQRVYDETLANVTRAKLADNGYGVIGARIGIPFPMPRNGQEAVWNHLLRWRGESLKRRTGQANPTAGGDFTMIMFEDDVLFRYAMPDFGTTENMSSYLLQRVVAPARLAGEILLVHETINQVVEPRSAWTYNPGARRVRRAPNSGYDNPGSAADGVRTADQFDIFNGALDRYDWTLVGRKEMYVPYNSYKLHSDALRYTDIIKPNHLNPDHLRYELHRVWVVEAKVKADTNHIYSRRTLYLDEDSWQVLAADHYDSRGQIWRVAEAHVINYYEVPTVWSTLDTSYDLQSGRYTALGFDNQEPMANFNVKLTPDDFSPDALRRAGER